MEWKPPYQIVKAMRAEERKMRKEAVKAAKEDRAKARGEAIAKSMKEAGHSVEKIAKFTQLSEKEIERL